jgi:hypothetical protein
VAAAKQGMSNVGKLDVATVGEGVGVWALLDVVQHRASCGKVAWQGEVPASTAMLKHGNAGSHLSGHAEDDNTGSNTDGNLDGHADERANAIFFIIL